MAKISYPTSLSIPRPLLIEAAHLTSLDVILDEFLKSRQRQQQEALKERPDQSRSRPQPIRTVDVYLSGGKTIKSSHFNDVIKQPHVSQEVPLGFRAYLRAEEVEATVSTAGWNRDLDMDVQGTDE